MNYFFASTKKNYESIIVRIKWFSDEELQPQQIFEQALIQVWQWLKTRKTDFCYSLSECISNPSVSWGQSGVVVCLRRETI